MVSAASRRLLVKVLGHSVTGSSQEPLVLGMNRYSNTPGTLQAGWADYVFKFLFFFDAGKGFNKSWGQNARVSIFVVCVCVFLMSFKYNFLKLGDSQLL